MGFRTNIVFKFENIPGLSFKCSLQKTFDEKTSLISGAIDETNTVRPIKTIKVLAVSDVKPSSIEDIQTVLPWNNLQFFKSIDEDTGETKLLKITKDILLKLKYDSDENYIIIDEISNETITSKMFNGKHYFVKCRKEKRGASTIISEDNLKLYNMIYLQLKDRKTSFVVKFVSFKKLQYCLLQADETGLFISVLIFNTFQRIKEQNDIITLDSKDEERSGKIFKKFKTLTIFPILEDIYEIKLREIIKKIKKGEKFDIKKDVTEPSSSAMDIIDSL